MTLISTMSLSHVAKNMTGSSWRLKVYDSYKGSQRGVIAHKNWFHALSAKPPSGTMAAETAHQLRDPSGQEDDVFNDAWCTAIPVQSQKRHPTCQCCCAGRRVKIDLGIHSHGPQKKIYKLAKRQIVLDASTSLAADPRCSSWRTSSEPGKVSSKFETLGTSTPGLRAMSIEEFHMRSWLRIPSCVWCPVFSAENRDGSGLEQSPNCNNLHPRCYSPARS